MEFLGNNTTLAEVDAYQRHYKKPAFVFLGILTVIGIFGNLLVIYIFGYKMKKKKVQHFITLLAVYDILCCLFGLPLKMLELWMPVTYPSSALCKIQNAVICFVCVASGLTLTVIAFDRYEKICRPTKAQMRLIHVKISFVVITLMSLLFAVVAVFVYGRVDMPLTANSDVVLHVCSLNFHSLLTRVYFMALIAVLVTILVILLVFYSLVWRTARKQMTEFPVIHHSTHSTTSIRFSTQLSQTKKPQKTNTTRVLVFITLLFVLSFVPSLAFSISFPKLFQRDFAPSVKAFIEFMYVTWGLNSSVNPIIYGFYNRNFLHHVRNIFSYIGVLKYQKSVTSAETSGS